MRSRSRWCGLGLLVLCAGAALPAAMAVAAGPSGAAAGAAAPSANVRLVRGLYDALARGDTAAAVGAMSPEIIWNEAEHGPLADRNPYVGPQAILDGVLGRIGARFNDFNLQIDRLLDAGDTVVMLGRYHGVNKQTGQSLNAQVVHVWTIADGKLAAFQQYTDTLQWTRLMQP